MHSLYLLPRQCTSQFELLAASVLVRDIAVLARGMGIRARECDPCERKRDRASFERVHVVPFLVSTRLGKPARLRERRAFPRKEHNSRDSQKKSKE